MKYNTVSGGDWGYGGGIFCHNNDKSKITNNIISHNKASDSGGGICLVDSHPTIDNNTIFKNTAYSIHGFPKGVGGGIYCSKCSELIANNIVWENIAEYHPQIYGAQNVSYCNVQGGYPGTGNIDSDPLFVDDAIEDFHLTFQSPCRDAGDNSAVTALTDFEGDLRIAYGTVDMGADEFYTHLYWTGEAAPGGNVELKFVGLPGTKPIQLWLGSGVLDHPLCTKYGRWYLQFPLLATIPNLGSVPSDGILVFPFTFPANTPAPLSLPIQAGIGMELSNLSVMEVK